MFRLIKIIFNAAILVLAIIGFNTIGGQKYVDALVKNVYSFIQDNVQESAKENDLITVLASPIDGYELTGIIFESLSPELTPEVAIVDNRATFAMPASNITITPIFSEIETLPSSIAATCIGNFTEEGSQPASAWAGTLESVGNTSFKPSIYVTSNGTAKNVIGTTTVTGNSAIYIAVVVNEAQENVSVRLSGVPSSTQSSTNDGSYEDRSNSNEEVD